MKITNRFAEHILFLIFKLALFCFLSVHLSAHVQEGVSRMRTTPSDVGEAGETPSSPTTVCDVISFYQFPLFT